MPRISSGWPKADADPPQSHPNPQIRRSYRHRRRHRRRVRDVTAKTSNRLKSFGGDVIVVHICDKRHFVDRLFVDPILRRRICVLVVSIYFLSSMLYIHVLDRYEM